MNKKKFNKNCTKFNKVFIKAYKKFLKGCKHKELHDIDREVVPTVLIYALSQHHKHHMIQDDGAIDRYMSYIKESFIMNNTLEEDSAIEYLEDNGVQA